MSLRETMLSGLRIPYQDVTIGLETGPVVIRIQALNGRRMLDYRRFLKEKGKDGPDADSETDGLEQICFSCFDPVTGEMLFKPEDVPFLQENMPLSEAKKIIEVINALNPTGDVGKLSEPTTTTASV